ERAPALRVGGYVVDFWGAGYEVADRMQLLPALHKDAYRIKEVRLVDASGKRVTGLEVQLFEKATHDRYLSILRSDLACRIYELVENRVETIFGDTITSLTEDSRGVTVSFERNAPRRFHLVVGADGLHSAVRRLGFGDDKQYEQFLGYYVGAFTADNYPRRDEKAYVSYTVPRRSLARYALRENRSAFLFIFAQDEILGVGHHDVAAQKSILRERFSGMGWESAEILEAMDGADDLYFDPVSQISMDNWSRGRVTLVGDAAYCPSLLAGEGSGLAMAGAHRLANALAITGGDYQAAFRRYQQHFKPFVDDKQKSARRIAWWFAPRSKKAIWMRNVVTSLLNLPYIGDVFAPRLFGDDYELPA
ncbi:MAG TPA: FAD-dependent monooxygenase, partial [Gemmatimonadaceae bacterium]|nr:FAD-dependent monooxygenase [Gemmatimonadaceae bacterium]